MFWFVLIVLILFLWTFALLALDGPNLEHFDEPVGEVFDAHPDDAAADQKFLSVIGEVRKQATRAKSMKKSMALIREFADNLSADLESDCEFIAADANGVPCEWAVAPGADPDRRVLFLHGGAFLMGSPLGHRKYADRLSHLAKAAVLSVDYRMMPEQKRMASSEDAQRAYRWVLCNGPQGEADVEWLLVAGDSAGGNLTLMLTSWANAVGLRKADGAIAFSPNTDTTTRSHSYRLNRKTDKILGPVLGKLALLPKSIGLWFALLSMRANPSNPVLSPVFADLSGLPPTLLHASSSELMLGDSVRYTNKALAAGSDVKLQIWEDQIHDWHLFNMGSGSADSAWREVDKFIQSL